MFRTGVQELSPPITIMRIAFKKQAKSLSIPHLGPATGTTKYESQKPGRLLRPLSYKLIFPPSVFLIEIAEKFGILFLG